MRRHRLVVSGVLIGLACSDPPTTEATPAPAKGSLRDAPAEPGTDDADEAAAKQRAQSAAQAVGKGLKGELARALSQGTPGAALEACAAMAQPATAKVAEEKKVSVGRSSLRLRNPSNAGPPWVAAWLEQQGQRLAAGVEGFTRIDVSADGKVARFLAPIAVEGLCLNCHGPEAGLSADVRAALKARYPDDAAVGYAIGDLRGAIWAEAKVAQR